MLSFYKKKKKLFQKIIITAREFCAYGKVRATGSDKQ